MSATPSQQHIPALDGIRALAIVAVIVFHMGASWLPGGYLGVDVFFVLSGYLITWILLDRYTWYGSINFREFYLSRIRRLVPAFVFLSFGIAIGVGLWAPDAIERFLRDLPWATAGLTNWWFILEQNDYFTAIGRPSLLQHTWSLAIEAQFYAIWPLLITVVAKKLHLDRVRIAAVIGALLSWTALVFAGMRAETGATAESHMYFGTDTHSSGLFIGAALAVAWIPRNLHTEISRNARRFINTIGGVGLAGLLWAFVVVNQTTGDFYTVGFPIVGVATALVIASVVHPASMWQRPLSVSVMQWLGTRSYGLYLWHWVIIQVLRPGIDVSLSTPLVIALQIITIAGIAEFSYRVIEVPIRRGALGSLWRSIKSQSPRTKRFVAVAAAVAVGVPLISAAAIDVRAVRVAQAERESITQPVEINPSAVAPSPSASAEPENPNASNLTQRRVVVFGDSVIHGAEQGFVHGFRVAHFDAEIAMQAHILIRKIRAFAQTDHGDVDVIFNIGVNGTMQPDHLTKIFSALRDIRRIVVITPSVPRPWEAGNLELIREWAARHPKKVVVADWHAASQGHPEYFVSDGVHLTPEGVTALVHCIQDAYTATS